METTFETEYKRLNKAQKDAVDTIDGPVMVVAGPGTGKTQILALRIANILQKTDTPADGILCLTFTNSGVYAMRERLRKYIGSTASRIQISTFHAFAVKVIEEHFETLGYIEKPTLMDDLQSVALADTILAENHFEHLTNRNNKSQYFRDIKSLVSLLKRERLSPDDFSLEIKKEIDAIKKDESNISTRGESKGSLKQEAVKRIEGLERTEEVVKFYALYELLKKAKGVIDFDDVLEELVRLVTVSEDVRDTIREQYLYVLVDEHQDSSGVQNEFLARVWGDVEQPNVFVVGDDRQLIYGFGGASLSYFEEFQEQFKNVTLVTLTENYRSTQNVLDVADTLLKSHLTEAKLIATTRDLEQLRIIEAEYPRDEILRAGLEMKAHIAGGMNPNECALLVPKNREVQSAIRVLSDLGLPVAKNGSTKLFTDREAQGFITILRALASPEAPEYLVPLLLSPLSGIDPLAAHRFLSQHEAKKLTLSKLASLPHGLSLYPEDDAISEFAKRLVSFLECAVRGEIHTLIQTVGEEILIKRATNHEILTRRIEIIRTLLHLVLSETERNPKLTLSEFLAFLDRLEEYDTDIPLATFDTEKGIRVMTLHGSKGLEFECVFICHLDEKNLLGRRNSAFTLPERIKELEHKKGEEEIKRELYVAITRAKRHCTLSYALNAYTGATLEMSHIIADLPGELFEKISAVENEAFIMTSGIDTYVKSGERVYDPVTTGALAHILRDEYYKHKLSVTHLNNFFECPWKWYFRNFLQLPEPQTMSLEFGNLVHGILERILKQKLKTDKKSITDAINEKAEKLCGFSDTDIARMKQEAEEIILEWVEKRLPSILPEHESEKMLSYRDPEFDHLLINGKIDLIEKITDGEVRVTDFKTGSVKKKSEIEKNTDEGRMSDYRRQLAMYTYLIDRTTEGNTDVAESRLEFLESFGEKDGIYKTEVTSDDVRSLIRDIHDFDQLLSSGEWIDRPCRFKPWKPGDVCEYCKLAEIYKKPY
jgi:DNA helicase-2/ATP-dependent DNA helicase PcrA